jgi:hypothetical protein
MAENPTTSPDPDVSIFIGRSLWSILIGPGNVVLSFCVPAAPGQSTPQTSISIGGPYRVQVRGSRFLGKGNTPKSAIVLTDLLLKDVIGAAITADRDFEMEFEDGMTLLVIRDNGGFESFYLNMPDGMYIFS